MYKSKLFVKKYKLIFFILLEYLYIFNIVLYVKIDV